MNPDADQFARVDVQGQGLFAKDFLDNMAGQSERLDLPGRRPPPHPLAHQDTPHGTADALLNGVLGATDEVRHDHAMTYARVGQRCEGLVGAGPEQAPPAATGGRDIGEGPRVLLPYCATNSETAIISFTRKRAGQLCGRGNTGCYHDDTLPSCDAYGRTSHGGNGPLAQRAGRIRVALLAGIRAMASASAGRRPAAPRIASRGHHQAADA